ncbi:undecaprenyl-phosphate glucose phosphotransferase [Lentilitoribacter sp. Alg239-R112]|uniref:undecaprenyl-phosphate glucose phosphotransferase n=1 Tax=Lentilitoribacter sp. Alg239-R112 TaxID=2305987 RepID=UPI0013A69581|nr:undecaprenyl-phosphate glucose phosphotransferase [Lentilitoribacter sp. Alg239-R112]
MIKIQKDKMVDASIAPSETVAHGLEEDNLNRLAQQIAQQLADENHSPALILGAYRLFECACIFATGILAYFYHDYPDNRLPVHAFIIFGTSCLTLASLQASSLYTTQSLKTGMRTLPQVLAILSTIFVVMAVAGYFIDFHDYFSKKWFADWFMGTATVLTVARLTFAFSISRWKRNGFMERRAVIVGGGAKTKQLIRDIEAEQGNDIRICGIFDDRGDDRAAPVIAGYPKLGNVKDVVAFARRTRIDLIIITLPLSAESRWTGMLKHLWVLPVDIRLAAHTNSMKFRPRFCSYMDNSKIPMLDLFDKPISDWDSVSKRGFDIVFSLLALALLWPIMLGTAIAIKLTSKGPIIFKQMRHGINNEEIPVYKFRSMYTDMSDEKAAKLVTKNDPRVTPVGRFIRKTSIDELPQLFNVLLGSVSLVGPRPHAVIAQAQNKYFADVVDGYFARHRVKPGITGWAQINGLRGEITSDAKIKERTEYDLYYIENWSLAFDLKILLKTPFSLFNTENAY